HLNDLATREYGAGIVECRICGFKFLPDVEEDRELHEQKHWEIICGGLPYDIREFVKRAAWDTLSDKRASEKQQEIAKRAIAFASWARAISNGIPENFFEPYMAAQLAYIDASVSGDEEQIDEAEHLISLLSKYG